MAPSELVTYFAAERQGGLLLVALGVAALGFSAYLWMVRSAFVAMAWPLVLLGAFEVMVGLAVALRTPAQVAALEEGLRTSRVETIKAETERMSVVNRNFRIVKRVEIAVLLTGLALFVLLPQSRIWSGVGLGLILQAAVLLAFDAFAHHRALAYTRWLVG